MRTIRIGTRGSRLALIQCGIVARMLEAAGYHAELVPITTAGDLRPPDTTPGEGVFVAAIAGALAAREIDLAVHSAKDIPVGEDPDLVIAAYPDRADPRDALLMARQPPEPRPGAIVGTDSPRRAGFLLARRPDLRIRPLHGNVDTRLRRLDQGEVDALVLAAAGLDRLGLGTRAAHRFATTEMPPAPGQGALAVQARRADGATLHVLRAIDRPAVRLAVISERAVLEGAGGGCRAPIGALARLRNGRIQLVAGAVEPDGSNRRVIELEMPADLELAVEACRRTGQQLRESTPVATHQGG